MIDKKDDFILHQKQKVRTVHPGIHVIDDGIGRYRTIESHLYDCSAQGQV
ncbi:MAG: hypothetical protein JRG97_03375 [Deltaproteobacteria bacterium]|nr:hypothetical protein [Deltaproteobacteria bacterium]MBW2053331.1 hypothetical protein [Deltaproteobacteria bacterium]MBW2140099.1 hypothetical protein [Deltaproteobacteria bacterium]MBW2324477.1 hypothetical protein [Deltaproteobacteria bacterium]